MVKKKWTIKYPIHIFLENFKTSMENKYTLKFTFAIEIQIDKLFTLALVTSINKFSCKYFSIKCSSVCYLKADVTNNLYLIVRSGCEFYIINVNFQFSSIINFSWEMNLLPSSIYMHLKTNSIKQMHSLILGVCGSQHISVFSDIFQF